MQQHFIITARVLSRIVRIFLECFLAFLLIYWLCTIVLSRWTVNAAAKRDTGEESVCVYLTSNGVHTDIIVPVRNREIDWGKELGISSELANDTTRTKLAFGWGNRRFFLNTKEWSDLTFNTAFGAAFHLGTSAMHLVQMRNPDPNSKDVIVLHLSKGHYHKLVGYLKSSFLTTEGRYHQITAHPYGAHNFFFEANRSYGLTYTCNSWANDALKSAEQRACKWTAFKDGIFVQYGKE